MTNCPWEDKLSITNEVVELLAKLESVEFTDPGELK